MNHKFKSKRSYYQHLWIHCTNKRFSKFYCNSSLNELDSNSNFLDTYKNKILWFKWIKIIELLNTKMKKSFRTFKTILQIWKIKLSMQPTIFYLKMFLFK